MVDIDDTLVEFIHGTAARLSREHNIPIPAKFGWNRKKNNCGQCSYQDGGVITLNVKYCQDNDYCQIYETIVHEMAHLACRGDNHGQKWSALYKAMGGSGKQFHDFEYAVSSATARVLADRVK